MSDQTSVISDLEELFLAREFGRFSVESPRAVEEGLVMAAPEPRELEELFLSRDFGRPVALELLRVGDEPAPNVVEFPFAGPGAKPFDPAVRQRAVAALSGVAAAVLVIAGLMSAGGPHAPGTTSALGRHSVPGGGTVVPDQGGTAPSPGPQAGAAPNAAAGSTTSGGADANVVFATQHAPTPSPSGLAPGAGPQPTGTGSGSTPPPPPPPGGGTPTGLAPANAIVGDLVSAAGSTVTGASGQVASVVPNNPGLVAPVAQTGNNITLVGEAIATPSGL